MYLKLRHLFRIKWKQVFERIKKTGKLIPRKIINKFSCIYNGDEVFVGDWHPSVSANPYMAFYVRAKASGSIDFVWTEDGGKKYKKSAKITVT